jgi:glc operon protein GlcG
MRSAAVVLCLLAAVAVPARGQVPVQEKRVLTLEGAKAVAAAAVAEAKRLNAPGSAIAVVDDGGHLLYLERLDNTFPMAATVAEGKARTAAVFHRPTKGLEDAILGGRTSLLNVAEAPLQGGVPIVVGGVLVGAVGVSGAASADQDTQIAEAAVAKSVAMR